MEALENVLARRAGNRWAGIGDGEISVSAVLARGDADATALSIIFARVLEKIAHDHCGVTFFARDLDSIDNVGVDDDLIVLRMRGKIVEFSFDELRQIDS